MIAAIFWIWIIPTVLCSLIGLLPLLCVITKGRWRKGFINITKFYYVGILVSLGFVVLFKKPIFQGKLLPALGYWLYASFAPTNLNAPLYESEVLPNSDSFVFSFQNKYIGFYKLELHFSSRVPQELVGDELRTKEEIEIFVQVRDGSEIIHEETQRVHALSYWGGDSDSGMRIYFYHVPEDLEFDKTYQVSVKLGGDIKEMINKYGPVYLKLLRRYEKFKPTFEVPLFNL